MKQHTQEAEQLNFSKARTPVPHWFCHVCLVALHMYILACSGSVIVLDIIILQLLFFFQKVRWLEVQSVEDNVVIDLEKMLEIDRGSGKTCCVQRVEKVSHIGNLCCMYLPICRCLCSFHYF